MSEYKYDREKFDEKSIYYIDIMIKMNTDKEVLDIATQIKEDGNPVFHFLEISKILHGVNSGLSTEQIKLYTITNNEHSVYDYSQMDHIIQGFESKLPLDGINIYTKLNEKMKPIFDSFQTREIVEALRNKISIENIKTFTKLNKRGEPIYHSGQMQEIAFGYKRKYAKEIIEYYSRINSKERPIYSGDGMRYICYGIENDLPLEYIDIYARLKDEAPIFADFEMKKMQQYITHLFKNNEIEKIKQLKECVDSGWKYKKIEPFINTKSKISTDQMRILRSFYELGASTYDIWCFLENNTTYEELKEVKYLLQCAKEIEINKDAVLHKDLNLLKDRVEELSEQAAAKNLLHVEEHEKYKELIGKCLSYKMPPEQIGWIVAMAELINADNAKKITIGFLNGMTTEEYKEIIHKFSTSENYEIENLLEDINNITNSKISSGFDLDELVDIQSVFEEKDR